MTKLTSFAKLDKSMFNSTIQVLGLRVPNKNLSSFLSVLKKSLLNKRNTKPVIQDETSKDTKLILFHEKFKSINDLPKEQVEFIEKQKQQDIISDPITYKVNIGYDDLKTGTSSPPTRLIYLDEILRKVLPPNIKEVPSSFESVGHIAHVNLHDELLPYKYVIGQVILDKNASIKTVVNKVSSIETKFREFKMELLAGIDKYDVEVKEHGCRYKFNYKEVYWNSRLATEHQRLLKFFKQSDVICDMFAGVGPFAIPAAKKVKCRVHANDLNPKSFEYLKLNSKLNKVEKLIHTYNMDGREFIKFLLKKEIHFNHVIMNLPGSAVEFLDVFIHAFPTNFTPLPIIHCYAFVDGEDQENKAKKSVEDVIGTSDIEYICVFNVRDVAPRKNMWCVSFKLPEKVGYYQKRKLEDDTETSEKKMKI